MKRVLVKCFYGYVFVIAPRATKRNVIYQMVLDYWRNENSDPCISGLPNYSYLTETEYRKESNRNSDDILECADIIS